MLVDDELRVVDAEEGEVLNLVRGEMFFLELPR